MHYLVILFSTYLLTTYTVQALKVIINLYKQEHTEIKPVLILVPSVGLVKQWAAEAEKFTTGLNILAVVETKVTFFNELYFITQN